MAEPVPFAQANMTMRGGDTGAIDMPVQRVEGECPQFISKWVFTRPELEMIAKHGCVFLHVMGGVHPPVAVTAPVDAEVES